MVFGDSVVRGERCVQSWCCFETCVSLLLSILEQDSLLQMDELPIRCDRSLLQDTRNSCRVSPFEKRLKRYSRSLIFCCGNLGERLFGRLFGISPLHWNSFSPLRPLELLTSKNPKGAHRPNKLLCWFAPTSKIIATRKTG